MFFFFFLVGWASLASATESIMLLRGAKPPPPPMPVWTSQHCRVFYGDAPYFIKGVNWNGIESDCCVPHGLWQNSLSFYLDLLVDHGFNSLRVPLSFEVMQNLDLAVSPACVRADPQYANMSLHDFLRRLLDDCWSRGVSVLFDLHTIQGEITPYPWTDLVTEENVVDAWKNLVLHFGTHPALMALEIKNEPHGEISAHTFQSHCRKVIEHIESLGLFRGLYFISGVQIGNDAPWGGSVGMDASCSLCGLHVNNRIVFSPHVYGPDVRGERVAREGWPEMQDRFGFLYSKKGQNPWQENAIVVTEFGGHMEPGSADLAYFERWKVYMESHNMTAGSYFWTLPQTSADTGGLITGAEWNELDLTKLNFLDRLQPSPTKLKTRKAT